MSLCFSVVLYVGIIKLIHEVVWSHVAVLSSLIYDSLLHLFVYFNLMLMHVSSVVSDLCDPMDYSSGSSVHGILQAGILEWVFLTMGGNLHLLNWQVDSKPLSPLGSPNFNLTAWGKSISLVTSVSWWKKTLPLSPPFNLQLIDNIIHN